MSTVKTERALISRKYKKNKVKFFNIRVSNEMVEALSKLSEKYNTTKTDIIEKLVLDAASKID